MGFENLPKTTADLAQEQLAKLCALFPECVTESERGLAVDFDLLRRALSPEAVVEGPNERYRLEWPGKRAARYAANAPTASTLRPVRERSKDFDATQNLYIEGDNLEALKLLRTAYAGKVKLIYIDPPYNTGHDFIYHDKYVRTVREEMAKAGLIDDEGRQTEDKDPFQKNDETNGRYHSDWLTMMYPRLLLARDLLTDDGVIFISIDDNEQANLKRLCDEVFGAGSFVTTIHCQMSTTQGMKVKAAQEGNIVKNAEYVLCYTRDGHKTIAQHPLYDLRERYDEHYSLFLREDGTIGQLREEYDFRFPSDCNNKKPYKLAQAYAKSEDFAKFVREKSAQIACSDKVTGFNLSSEIKNKCWTKVVRSGKEYLLTLDETGHIRQLLRLSSSWGMTDGFYEEEGLRKIRGDWWAGFYIDMGNVGKEGGVDFRNGKKPLRLIKQLIKMSALKDGDLVMDFFSGSATTAHAVMALNAEDGGNRKFILVQLPEKAELGSAAAEAGFANICEIGEERIRRAGEKILGEHPELRGKLDVGFRVLRLDEKNEVQAAQTPDDALTNWDVALQEETIKEGRTEEDLLFQALLRVTEPLLVERIEREEVAGLTVWSVADGFVVACLAGEGQLTAAKAEAVTRWIVGQAVSPSYVAFREAGFADDSVKLNVEAGLRQAGCKATLWVL